ncbi:hypothetical protein RCL1_004995 [Eukaryota sp. TZLM3-RCL]
MTSPVESVQSFLRRSMSSYDGTLSDGFLSEFSKAEQVLRHATNQDVILFIGNTGSGKSTLVNILSNVPLVFQDLELKLVNKRNGVEIGGENRSVTKIPNCVWLNNHGLVYDLPGFRDTEGSEANLFNLCCLHHLLTVSKSVKIVYTISSSEVFSTRGQLLKSVEQLFQTLGQPFCSTSLICVVNKLLPNDPVKHNLSMFTKFVSNERVLFFSRVVDHNSFIKSSAEFRSQLLSNLRLLQGSSITHLDLSTTLQDEVTSKVSSSFSLLFCNHLMLLESLSVWKSHAEKAAKEELMVAGEELFEVYSNSLSLSYSSVLLRSFLPQLYDSCLHQFKYSVFYVALSIFSQAFHSTKELESLDNQITEKTEVLQREEQHVPKTQCERQEILLPSNQCKVKPTTSPHYNIDNSINSHVTDTVPEKLIEDSFEKQQHQTVTSHPIQPRFMNPPLQMNHNNLLENTSNVIEPTEVPKQYQSKTSTSVTTQTDFSDQPSEQEHRSTTTSTSVRSSENDHRVVVEVHVTNVPVITRSRSILKPLISRFERFYRYE